MVADKRNALVIVALIASMTAGAHVLLWMEPGKPRWTGDTLLMAQRGTSLESVHVGLATRETADALLAAGGEVGVCVVYPDESPQCRAGGAALEVVIVESAPGTMPELQQKYLLATLAGVRAGAAGGPRVELAADSDAALVPDLPEQARSLRSLLVKKGLISEPQ